MSLKKKIRSGRPHLLRVTLQTPKGETSITTLRPRTSRARFPTRADTARAASYEEPQSHPSRNRFIDYFIGRVATAVAFIEVYKSLCRTINRTQGRRKFFFTIPIFFFFFFLPATLRYCCCIVCTNTVVICTLFLVFARRGRLRGG